jgi:hypothetical protein
VWCVCREVISQRVLFLEQDHQQTQKIGNLYPPTNFVSLSKHSISLRLLNERANEDGSRCSSQSVRTRGWGSKSFKYVLVMGSFEERLMCIYYLGAQTPWFLKPLDFYYYRYSYSECSDYVPHSIFVTWSMVPVGGIYGDRGIMSAENGRFCGI